MRYVRLMILVAALGLTPFGCTRVCGVHDVAMYRGKISPGGCFPEPAYLEARGKLFPNDGTVPGTVVRGAEGWICPECRSAANEGSRGIANEAAPN